MVGQCRRRNPVTAQLEVEIVAENVPEIAVQRAGIFGGDIAGVRVDVELDQPQPGLVFAHGLQRGPAAGDQRCFAGHARAHKGRDRIPRPDLWIACRQRRGAIAVRRHTVVDDVERPFAGFVKKLIICVHVAPVSSGSWLFVHGDRLRSA